VADVDPAQNRASRRTAGRNARRLAAIGSGAVLATGAVGALVGTVPSAGAATTIVVTNTLDMGAGSLRQALADANTGDTIDLTGLSGAITLTSGQLDITKAVTITGPGASALTISGNGASRVFSMDVSLSGGTVTISGLTITDGAGVTKGGGVFFNCEGGSGSIVIDSTVVSGNTASGLGGGLYFDRCDGGGSMTLTNTVVSGNSTTDNGAGGIWFDQGTALNIVNSTISGNHTDGTNGGGILFDDGDTLSVIDSTISGNSAAHGGGGGISVGYPKTGATIANSTITGNSAPEGGGVRFRRGASKVLQSTISGNTAGSDGDGLYLESYTVVAGGAASAQNQPGDGLSSQSASIGPAVVTLTSSIVAGNADGTDDISGGNSVDAATITSSVIGAVSTITVTDGGGNHLGVTAPGLAPLAANGGPTQTMALLTGSVAIDAGANPVPAFTGNEFDQRGAGFARVSGAAADAGAFEVQVVVPAPIDIAPKFTG